MISLCVYLCGLLAFAVVLSAGNYGLSDADRIPAAGVLLFAAAWPLVVAGWFAVRLVVAVADAVRGGRS